MKQRATMRDVAREANVSLQTVSRVVNNKGEISPATRQRVVEAIEKLHYRPSRTARSLARGRSHTVGLIVPTIANPFFAELAKGVQDVARSHDYNVFMCNTEWDPAEEVQLLYSLASQPVDGIILCSSRSSDEDLGAFCDTFRPVVLGGRLFEHPSTSLILRDSEAGMKEAIGHLLVKGHKEIAMLAAPQSESSMSSALASSGFRHAMAHHGLDGSDDRIVHGAMTPDGGYESALILLQRDSEVTALCAHNDLMAIGAIKAVVELGHRIPEEFAIVGYNDIALAAVAQPPLTTIRVDTQADGRMHMTRLLEMINNPEVSFPPHYHPIHDLIVRESA